MSIQGSNIYVLKTKVILILILSLSFCQNVKSQLTVKGFIVDNKQDTIKATIWKNKKKRLDKKRNYSRITIIDSTRKEVVLSPDQILAYSKDGIYYKSIRPKNRHSFFVKNITYGKVELYYFRPQEKYIFKTLTEKEFYIIDKEISFSPKQSTFFVNTGNNNLIPATTVLLDSEKKFREFFIPYFENCPLISNKIKVFLYKHNDIEVMFKHYNQNCE